MASKYFHRVLGSDQTGDGTAANPFATLDKAMEQAGSGDCVYGGGVGTFTWAKIVFADADTGSDANDGLRPDRAYASPVTAWNSHDVRTTDTSLLVLVKGTFTWSSTRTLQYGGRRNTSYVSTSKVMRGYTGTSWFGTGKAVFRTTGVNELVNLSSCDNAGLVNITLRNESGSGGPLIGTSGGCSYGVHLENCELLGFTTAISGDYHVDLFDLTLSRCRAVGRSKASSPAVCGSYAYWHAYGCLFGGVQRLYTGSEPSSLVDCIIDGCQYGLVPINTISIYTNLIIANCDTGIQLAGYTTAPCLMNSILYNNAILLDGNAGGIVLRGCCLHNNGGYSLAKTGGEDTTDGSFIDAESFFADPGFCDPANGDFRLSDGSPCWNMGLANPFITGNIGPVSPQGRNVAAARAGVLREHERQLLIVKSGDTNCTNESE